MLDRGETSPFVLLSAPAGTGKTALLADWVAEAEEQDRTAWITFEGVDVAFWPGVVECLKSLGVRLPPRAVPAGDGRLDRHVRRRIAEAVASHPNRLTVVVDGYELLSAEVAEDLDFLLRHSGHRLRMVMVTRADPVLPLYRYRLDDKVVEVRMTDLAFTDEEAGELLERAGVTLAPESVHALNVRTRGWAAGLRFAAKLLLLRQHPDDAVAEIVGDTGNIAEYLVREVLDAQSPEVRALLLATSIPETIQPGLAEALGGPSAARVLAFLTRNNVFIEPVPGHRGFYRYHPFFRDLLRAELAYEAPDEMRRLQREAAEWFAREGLITSAVGHFAAIGAWEEAATEVVDDLAVGQLLIDNGTSVLARSLRSIPDEVADPSAALVRATLALGAGDRQGVTHELADVRTRSGERSGSHGWAENVTARVLDAVRARSSVNPSEAMVLAKAAEQALEPQGSRSRIDSHPELRALVHTSMGMAAMRQGELAKADVMFKAGVAASSETGSEPILAEGLGYRALIACHLGELSRAAKLGARAVGPIEDMGIGATGWSSVARTALAWVEMERYDLRAAADHVRSVEQLELAPMDPIPAALQSLIRARLQVAHGDRPGALGGLEQATAGVPEEDVWLSEQLRVELAYLRVAAGEPAEAILEVEGLDDDPGATLVVGLAQSQLGDTDAADAALASVLSPRTSTPTRVSGWLVECARRLREGAPVRAHQALRQALGLAAPERLRRPFHEAPAAVRQLLVRDVELCAEYGWLFEVSGRPSQRLSAAKPSVTPSTGPVVEGLTERELEVLGHLANLLSTEEIASVMYISVNTIRTHVRNILRKLGVTRRNAAVRRARELQLLSQ
ncbi:LuxR C-terminal-related transcriptional regulator [Nocardioides sp. LHG3406-4]|uniref:LuxR C-terminal-related transcriptional regulator n=1 Tax=Nocardioides sp. LHG3406-4 TaxID=2804575 RepID=UPI003CF0AC41